MSDKNRIFHFKDLKKEIPKERIKIYLENKERVLNNELSISKLARENKIDRHYLSDIFKIGYEDLNGHYYFKSQGLNLMKDIIKFYEENNSSFKQIEEKFGIDYKFFKKFYCYVYNKKESELHNYNNIKYDINRNIFNKIDTEEKAYWLGFILADGYLYSKENSLRIKLGRKDKDHIIKFINFINGNIDDYLKTEINHKTGNILYKVSLYCKEIHDDLTKYGIYQGKSCKEKPYYEIDKDLIRHYIRGYFDGDGSIFHDLSRIKFVGSNENLSWIIKQIESSLNLPLKVKPKISINDKKSNSNLMNFYICNNADKRNVLNYLYKDSKIYLDRKFILYKKFLKAY